MTTTIAPKNTHLKPAQLAILTVSIFISAFMVLALADLLLTGLTPGNHDFVSYWSAAQQFVHHQNPYDAKTVLALESKQGFPSPNVLLMRNPPWALPLVAAFGLVSFRVGALLWSFLLLACFAASIWIYQGVYQEKKYLSLLGYFFGAGFACILAGQTGIFALLGLVLFLRLHISHPFLAGFSLWFCLLKPHLFLAFGIVLIVWIVYSKTYSILWGALSSLVISALVPLLLDPRIYGQYRIGMAGAGIESEFLPCLSVALRNATGIHSMQYALSIVACVWGIFYFWKRRRTWDWLEHGSPLMLISLLAAPYAWITDHVVVIPALLHGAYRAKSINSILALALLNTIIDVQLLCRANLHSPLFLWAAPAWCIWYYASVASSKTGLS